MAAAVQAAALEVARVALPAEERAASPEAAQVVWPVEAQAASPEVARAVWPAAALVGYAAAAVAENAAAAVEVARWDACYREYRKRRGKLSPRSSCSSPKLKAQP